MVNKKLLEILICPVCKSEVKLEAETIICKNCGKKFPVVNEIIVMLDEKNTTQE